MTKKEAFGNWREATPLKWPEGLGRTLINDRQSRPSWNKNPLSKYVKQVVEELELLGAGNIEITYNGDPKVAERDPGVAVWYSLNKSTDSSWQQVLRIDNPNPTREIIDRQFKRLVMEFKCHPDQVTAGSGGDIKVYQKLEEAWRSAKTWVSGDIGYGLNNCLPCDIYVDVKQNMACLRLQLNHIRAMKRLGNPFIVERIMERGFREALPSKASESAA